LWLPRPIPPRQIDGKVSKHGTYGMCGGKLPTKPRAADVGRGEAPAIIIADSELQVYPRPVDLSRANLGLSSFSEADLTCSELGEAKPRGPQRDERLTSAALLT
jgi:hypothetical protein